MIKKKKKKRKGLILRENWGVGVGWSRYGTSRGWQVAQAATTGACVLSHFSHVLFFVMLWAVACQAPLSVGFSRQEYWK